MLGDDGAVQTVPYSVIAAGDVRNLGTSKDIVRKLAFVVPFTTTPKVLNSIPELLSTTSEKVAGVQVAGVSLARITDKGAVFELLYKIQDTNSQSELNLALLSALGKAGVTIVGV